MAKSKHPELTFEKKNKRLQKIPKNARVQKRTILHPPVASPYAGASIPKVVYISTKTPFMCAVKRVQKLLGHAEKRATSKVDLSNNKISEKAKLEKVVQAQEALEKEEVIIMATGRAIDKALSLEKWFKERDEEYKVEVRTKAVLVVDDIMPDSKTGAQEGGKTTENGSGAGVQSASLEKGGDEKAQGDSNGETAPLQGDKDVEEAGLTRAKLKSIRRKQRSKQRKTMDCANDFDLRTASLFRRAPLSSFISSLSARNTGRDRSAARQARRNSAATQYFLDKYRY